MVRAAFLLLSGALVGAAATYYFAPRDADVGAPSSAASDAAAYDAAGLAAAAGPPLEIAERLSIYEIAVDATPAELEWRIEEAAQATRTRSRQFTLEVLLTRLAEDDPERAVRIATDLALEASVVSPLLQMLAETDENAALRVLEAQLTHALSLDGSTARAALAETAKTWARLDARGALERLDSISDTALRALFEQSVVQEWSSSDPIAAFEHVATRNVSSFPGAAFGPAMEGLMRADPKEVLALAERLPSQTSTMVRQIALQQLAQQDPRAAVAYIEALPVGMDRQSLMSMLASAYGSVDPDAALEWAERVRSPVPNLFAMVLSGVAQKDPDRALDLALARSSPMERMQAVQMIVLNVTATGSVDARSMAEKLLSIPSADVAQQALSALISSWVYQDGEAAVDWLLANQGRVRGDVFSNLAQMFPQQNPEAAAAYVDRIPSTLRTQWISAVATGYGQSDADRALSWVARFRGDPAYAAIATAAAQGLANNDPPAAARLLEELGPDMAATGYAAVNVASQWTYRDPAAAAQWAEGIDAAELRDTVMATVAQSWVALDSDGARGWVLSLPFGAARDRMLAAMMPSVASIAAPDARLMSAFSNDRTRQEALLGTIHAIAYRDRAEAELFIHQYFTDPALRQQAESALASLQSDGGFGGAPGVFIGSSP